MLRNMDLLADWREVTAMLFKFELKTKTVYTDQIALSCQIVNSAACFVPINFLKFSYFQFLSISGDKIIETWVTKSNVLPDSSVPAEAVPNFRETASEGLLDGTWEYASKD